MGDRSGRYRYGHYAYGGGGWAGGGRDAFSYERERHYVGQKFGGIDEAVLAALFALTPGQLAPILEAYSQRYGSSAGAYARTTFNKWRSGSTNMSGKTL